MIIHTHVNCQRCARTALTFQQVPLFAVLSSYASAAFSQHCSTLQGHWSTGAASLSCLRRSCLDVCERDEETAVVMVRALLHAQMIKYSRETPQI